METNKKTIDAIVRVLKDYTDGRLNDIARRQNITFSAFESSRMANLQGGVPLDLSLFRAFLKECGGGTNVWVDNDKTGLLPDIGDSGVIYLSYNAENVTYDLYVWDNGNYYAITNNTLLNYLKNDIEGTLRDELDSKSDISHTHPELQAELETKADSTHTHQELQESIDTLNSKVERMKPNNTVYFKPFTAIENASQAVGNGYFLLNGLFCQMKKGVGGSQIVPVIKGTFVNIESGETAIYKAEFGDYTAERPTDNRYYIDETTDKIYAYNENADEWAELTSEQQATIDFATPTMVVPILWADLKELRDSNGLTAGVWYRITDYQCTTTQADTMSANHPFDILVLATDDHTLNENARAMHHEGDTYFADCNLDAWELKYCLDNDTTRFLWAETRENDEIIGYSITEGVWGSDYFLRQPENDQEINGVWHYAWYCKIQDFLLYLPEEYPNTEEIGGYYIDNSDTLCDFHTQTLYSGRGVIYQMTDEWGNRCPYDFKNMMFKRYKVQDESPNGELADLNDKYLGFVGEMNGLSIMEWDFVWCYTFAFFGGELDSETGDYNVDTSIITDASLNIENRIYEELYGEKEKFCRNNTIESLFAFCSFDETQIYLQMLNNIVFINGIANQEKMFSRCNKIAENCSNMSFYFCAICNEFKEFCYSIIAYQLFWNNTFGNGCGSNTFGNDCGSNTFGNYFYSNTFGNGCDSNTFGNDCGSNTFGNYFYSNTFGNNCYSNTFGNNCYSNTFGNGCDSNTFGDNCYSNTFGNYCYSNTFGNYFYSNTFGNGCGSNTFGNYCYSNTFGNDCYSNTFGNRVNNTRTPIDNVRYCRFGDWVQYVNLTSLDTSGYLSNVEVRSGVVGTPSNYKQIEADRSSAMCNPVKQVFKSADENVTIV